MSKQPTTMDDLMDEFEFEVPGVSEEKTPDGITIEMGTEEEEAEKARLAEEAAQAAAAEANEGKTEEELAAEAEAEAKKKEEEAAEAAELEAAAEAAKQGDTSGYKSIALKYIEKGNWSEDLAIEDEEGNVVPVKDLENIDEETFFQIEEAVKAQEAEAAKDKFISVEGVDERRKNIMDIVAAGGDLRQIFKSAEEVEDYINPFSGLDLDNEQVQERLYLNALVKHNKLDEDIAQAVVDKAKKDLTLDSKVKGFVEQYTERFDKFVETKKEEAIQAQKDEAKASREFKKSLKEQYKAFDIKDSLANVLANSAVNKKDGEFEIDTVYAEKMENAEEAAELILFLKDKQAYLDFKLKESKISQQKKTRTIVKMIPRDKNKKPVETQTQVEDNEFEFTVKE